QSRVIPGDYENLSFDSEIDKVIVIDQSPIGRTPRSNPATYTKVFDEIRKIFAETKEAKMRGYKPGRFSFNVKGGRCEACSGDGLIKIEMNFLPDVYVECEECKGKRYNAETLEVKYKGKSIADVLGMTVEEALCVFENIPKIRNNLNTLSRVGLDYIKLGQSSTTLSGGEAQRIKLTRELSKKATGKTIYLLDEPTTGLHFHDVNKLISVLNDLVGKGNTVVVIEHNLDVIKSADYIVDLGPEGGDGGGRIIATGTPEEVAKVNESYTGQFLAPLLKD
ncbi:MAG: ATP-binding cassette domain-containing protein, partial [Methanogenium sp.]|nr:ATP-binding cassette domain-containing protein [Methanogenium sp.]